MIGDEFETEYEFFLHHLWSQKGFKISGEGDEYRNFREENPKRHYETTDEDVDGGGEATTFMREGGAEAYVQQVPISYNFLVPQTLILHQGRAHRWYYSTDMG